MDPIKKLKSKRGTTLVEVILVVALMVILLGIAVPNLIAESQAIKLAAMNGYARSVAVAVQSKLYGMKNAGTSSTSYYHLFNENAALETTLTTDEGNKLKYVSNFGEKGAEGKQYLLSGALTDIELLQSGKIVVVYDPETADVLETFYSDKEFDAESLFAASTDAFLKSNFIGIYRGEGAPAPVIKNALPTPSITMENGEELLANIYIPRVDECLYDQEVALEIYVADESGTKALIYGEGFYDIPFQPAWLDQTCIFKLDASKPLKLGDIQGKTLKFAVDSVVLTGVPWPLVRDGKLCFASGTSVLCEEYPMLFPRAGLLTQWLNFYGNPHYNAWLERNEFTWADYYNLLGQKLNVGDYIEIEVVLHAVMSYEDSGSRYPISSDGLHAVTPDRRYRLFYDDDAEALQKKSDEGFNLQAVSSGAYRVNGFFESAETREDGKTEVRISCVRHLQNLCTDGSMGEYYGISNRSNYCAKLMKDISGAPDSPWYQLLSKIRKDLIKQCKWNEAEIDANYPESQIRTAGALRRLGGIKEFVLDGGGHTISDLCINAKVWVEGKESFNSFYKLPDDFADFFQPIREYEDARDAATTYEEYAENEANRLKYYQEHEDWFPQHPSDCLATFTIKNCTLRGLQDDQWGCDYVPSDKPYIFP